MKKTVRFIVVKRAVFVTALKYGRKMHDEAAIASQTLIALNKPQARHLRTR